MKYLVAVDGSKSSSDALEYALDTAGQTGAHVALVCSVEPRILVAEGEAAPPSPGSDDRLYTEDISEAEKRGEKVLEAALERAREAGVEAESSLLYGDPVETIPEYVDAEGVDAVYVGHRGLSKRIEGLVGSVAEGLVEHLAVPVTVVR